MTTALALALALSALWFASLLWLVRQIKTTPPLRGLLSEIKEANRTR